MKAANLLVLYDPAETHIGTVEEHLASFARYSRHNVLYAAGTHKAAAVDLSLFDAVVIHYSVRICVEGHLSPAYARALPLYRGPKVLFIQDEYDATETTRRAIEQLGLGLVFTCVPDRYLEMVYPRSRFPSVRFAPTLTGYVPTKLEEMRPVRGNRPFLIGYRGRNLPYWYGDLAREKMMIGKRMREICVARGVPVNIEWEDAHRIYGPGWYDFMRSCTATLGTESGANVFDDVGDIRRSVEAALKRDPGASYEALRPSLIAPHEGKVQMNQVSPRLFEAIACGTALVLFEGGYSGVVRAEEHFIPLRKDFSNVDEVIQRLRDDAYVAALTERAYSHVIESGRYSYRAFVAEFDGTLETVLVPDAGRSDISSAMRGMEFAPGSAVQMVNTGNAFAAAVDSPLTKSEWIALRRVYQGRFLSFVDDCVAAATGVARLAWRVLPLEARTRVRSAAGRLRHRLAGHG